MTTRISFDEPSSGKANSDDPALEVKQEGGGVAVSATSKKIGILAEAGTSLGQGGTLGEGGTAVYAKGNGKDAIGVNGRVDWGIGVKGYSINHFGVSGSGKDAGVFGESHDLNGVGVSGESEWQEGVVGKSVKGKVGVFGECTHVEGAGVKGKNLEGIGVLGIGEKAGRFEGDVEVTGDIKLVNADCAEDFDIAEENVEPGTVMVVNENGSLEPGHQEYDKKVAGIVSGASRYKPAIILDSRQPQNQSQNDNPKNKNKERLPIALMGKVYCKVDARYSCIEIGDLLTTSSTKGHAMKAEDPMKSFGSVIGKALGSIKEGIGMIPVLVALQ